MTEILPPLIIEHFPRKLLETPVIKFKENSKTLESIFFYIKYILKKKTKSGKNEHKKQKCEKLINEFNGIYESIQIKEKEREKEIQHKTQMPFYSIGNVDRKNEKIFSRIKFRRKKQLNS